jgi:hypothetical protein
LVEPFLRETDARNRADNRRKREWREPDAGSILGAVVHSERNIAALQVAIDRGVLPDRECTAEAAQERRRIPIDQVE